MKHGQRMLKVALSKLIYRKEGKNLQRLQKLVYLHLFTDCFMKIPFHSLEENMEVGI